MTNKKQTWNAIKEPRTRYGPFSRYDIEAGGDAESNDTAGGMKNFPSTFIPMKELEESLAGE